MKVVVQRVKSASVTIGNEITGAIEEGLLLLVGIHQDDTEEQLKWMCDKILKLRIFEDEDEKMNLSVSDIEGGILVVSQFTLYGNAKKGTRPSFIEAAKPDKAEPMYEDMINYFKEHSELDIQTGKFGAMMDVELVNDGPVTLIMEK
ncbi:MAG: D-aminoacyl-tRNA deacylase [Balneola sp.]